MLPQHHGRRAADEVQKNVPNFTGHTSRRERAESPREFFDVLFYFIFSKIPLAGVIRRVAPRKQLQKEF